MGWLFKSGQDEGVVDGDIRRTEGRIAQELGTVRDLDAIRVNPLLTTEFDQGRVFRTLLETRMQLHDAHRIGRLPLTAFNSSADRSEEHTSELQSRENLVCRLLLEK